MGFRILREKEEKAEKKEVEIRGDKFSKANKWTEAVTKEMKEKNLSHEQKLELIRFIQQGRREISENGRLSSKFVKNFRDFIENIH